MRQILELKNWQIEAFQVGRPARYYLSQAPGGSGKSLLQVLLAQADIDDTGNKQLILVPKNHIHHGFFDDECIEFVLPGNSKPSRWTVAGNFCSTSPEKIKRLKEFLLADVRELRRRGGLAAIATHRAMVAAWAMMRLAERKQALRNISFRIDEAHHISNAFHEGDLGLFNVKDREAILEDGTRLGSFVRYVLRHNDETVKMHLATATFFRGDKRTILSEGFKNEFVHFYLPWDEHFQTLGIEHFCFDYINYIDDPVPNLLEIVKRQGNERHLVIIPALTHRFRTCKTLSTLMAGLTDVFPKGRVLDLVTPATQEAHKTLLHQHPERFQVVVACRLFDEGTDWVPCTRLHNTDACETSVTLAVQRIFRPLRQHPEKKDVRIYNYLPDFSPEMTQEEKRKVLSNRFNAFLACIATHGELMPCLVPIKAEKKGAKSGKVSLQEVYGEDYFLVLADLVKGYELVEDKADATKMEAVAEAVLKEYGVPDEVDSADLKAALLSQLVRIARPKNGKVTARSLQPEGIDAEAIRVQGFDRVWSKVEPVSSAICYGTDNIDVSAVRALLNIVHRPPSLEEINDGIRKFWERKGKRPTFHQSEWMDELDRSARSVDKLLRRHHSTTLAKQVRVVLGDQNNELIARTHDLIREYWAKGIRIGNKYGYLPEIGMTSFALNGRLEWNHGTTLAKEVEKILGPHVKPLTLLKARQVVRKYLRKGIRLHRKYGHIPELDMSSHNLADRLERNFKVTLTELVEGQTLKC